MRRCSSRSLVAEQVAEQPLRHLLGAALAIAACDAHDAGTPVREQLRDHPGEEQADAATTGASSGSSHTSPTATTTSGVT